MCCVPAQKGSDYFKDFMFAAIGRVILYVDAFIPSQIRRGSVEPHVRIVAEYPAIEGQCAEARVRGEDRARPSVQARQERQW